MNYASPERQRIARLNALGVKADKFILDNGIQLPARPVQFNHDQPIEVMSGPPPGHPAALPYFDDNYTGGVPDDGYGQ